MLNKTNDQVLYQSPIGWMRVHCDDGYIVKIAFIDDVDICDQEAVVNDLNAEHQNNTTLSECLTQLDMYFKGKLKTFSIKCRINGTDFQKRVWQALGKIPFGKTISYKDLATKIKQRNAMRAVGGANNKNNLCIVLPCHRVIGSDGSLTGYAGGLWRKEWLLNHERTYASTL